MDTVSPNTPTTPQPAPSATAQGSSQSSYQPASAPRRGRFSPQMIFGTLALVLLIVGGGVGLILSRQQQDVRQQAHMSAEPPPGGGDEGCGAGQKLCNGYCINEAQNCSVCSSGSCKASCGSGENVVGSCTVSNGTGASVGGFCCTAAPASGLGGCSSQDERDRLTEQCINGAHPTQCRCYGDTDPSTGAPRLCGNSGEACCRTGTACNGSLTCQSGTCQTAPAGTLCAGGSTASCLDREPGAGCVVNGTAGTCSGSGGGACSCVANPASSGTGGGGGSGAPTGGSPATGSCATRPETCQVDRQQCTIQGAQAGYFCNCPVGYVCQGLSGDSNVVNINGIQTRCFTQASSTITCQKIGGTPTTLQGGAGTACDHPLSRGVCGGGGCSQGSQRTCIRNSAGQTVLGDCVVTDACAAQQQSVTQGASCQNLRQLSVGEPSRGAFVGCQGTQNCFCPGGAGTSGSVVCYNDIDNDSCGAPGLNQPVATPSPIAQQSNPPSSNPPGSNPPSSYSCNSACTSDAQCQTASGSYVCYNGNCRMNTNPTSPTCQPPVGPVCLNITNNGELTLNNTVTFTCGTVQGATRYEFRIRRPDGTLVDLTAANGGNVSQSFTITSSGSHRAQCRICTGTAASTCQAYEAI